MNNERLLLDHTHFKFGKKTINYLLKENNFKVVDEKDKKELINIKNKLDAIFWQGVLIGSFTYICFSKLVLKNKKFGIIQKNKILRHAIDFSSIVLFSSSVAAYNDYYFISTFKNKIKRLREKYKILIKNSVALNEEPYNSNLESSLYETFMQKIDKHNEKNFYFIFLLFIRILI